MTSPHFFPKIQAMTCCPGAGAPLGPVTLTHFNLPKERQQTSIKLHVKTATKWQVCHFKCLFICFINFLIFYLSFHLGALSNPVFFGSKKIKANLPLKDHFWCLLRHQTPPPRHLPGTGSRPSGDIVTANRPGLV